MRSAPGWSVGTRVVELDVCSVRIEEQVSQFISCSEYTVTEHVEYWQSRTKKETLARTLSSHLRRRFALTAIVPIDGNGLMQVMAFMQVCGSCDGPQEQSEALLSPLGGNERVTGSQIRPSTRSRAVDRMASRATVGGVGLMSSSDLLMLWCARQPRTRNLSRVGLFSRDIT